MRQSYTEGKLAENCAWAVVDVDTHLPRDVDNHLPRDVGIHIPRSVAFHLPRNVDTHFPRDMGIHIPRSVDFQIPLYNPTLGCITPNPTLNSVLILPAKYTHDTREILRERGQAARYFQAGFIPSLNNPVLCRSLVIATLVLSYITPAPHSPCIPPRPHSRFSPPRTGRSFVSYINRLIHVDRVLIPPRTMLN